MLLGSMSSAARVTGTRFWPAADRGWLGFAPRALGFLNWFVDQRLVLRSEDRYLGLGVHGPARAWTPSPDVGQGETGGFHAGSGMTGSDQLGAIVVLRPAGGVTDEPITARTLERHRPDPSAAERARDWFAHTGFSVGPLVGVSFSVVAPAERMRSTFPNYEASVEQELALDALPADVAATVQAVTTESPPDFGPGNP